MPQRSTSSAKRPSLLEVSNYLKDLVNWEPVAVELGFEASSILRIGRLPDNMQKLRMITEWLQTDCDASMVKLKNALIKSKNEPLAANMQLDFSSGESERGTRYT